MPNIVLTRIDNRLVHGQVATQWCGAIGANLILVANDEVAGNSLRQGLMNMADRKSTRLNSSHSAKSRMPSSA